MFNLICLYVMSLNGIFVRIYYKVIYKRKCFEIDMQIYGSVMTLRWLYTNQIMISHEWIVDIITTSNIPPMGYNNYWRGSLAIGYNN